MSIDKQVKELRELADISGSYGEMIINQAADTIESLSAKLQAENTERSASDYNSDIFTEILENLDKRIGAQLKIMAGLNDETQRYGYGKALDAYQQIKTYVEITPEEHDSIFAKFKGTDAWRNSMFEKISNDVNVTVEDEEGNRSTMTLYTTDGKWAINSFLNLKVIAWQPLPEHMTT